MKKRCVVYLRVSTPTQSLGSGLVRQLETCIDYAKKNRLYIAGVYGDACSGDGPMPNRQLAYLAANQLRCPILVETRDRWSRMGWEEDVLRDAHLVYASDAYREFVGKCEQLICDAIYGQTRRLT